MQWFPIPTSFSSSVLKRLCFFQYSSSCLAAKSPRLKYFLSGAYKNNKTQGLTHWGRDKMDVISQTTGSSAFSWKKMFEFRLKFHWSLFLRVQLTIIQHCFRQWLGAVQATSHYLKQWWLVHWRIYASPGLNELNVVTILPVLIFQEVENIKNITDMKQNESDKGGGSVTPWGSGRVYASRPVSLTVLQTHQWQVS